MKIFLKTEFLKMYFSHYQRLINIKKAIYQVVTKLTPRVSLITLFFVNNPNSLGYKAFVFLRVKQN
jgi:hypothetical protein